MKKFKMLTALVLAMSINLAGASVKDVIPKDKSIKEYIEVKNKNLNGEDLVSFRVCSKSETPCSSSYLGYKRWYAKRDLKSQMKYEIAQATGAGVVDALAAVALVFGVSEVLAAGSPEIYIGFKILTAAKILTANAVIYSLQPVNVVAQARQAAVLRDRVLNDESIILDWKEDSIRTFAKHLSTVLNKVN